MLKTQNVTINALNKKTLISRVTVILRKKGSDLPKDRQMSINLKHVLSLNSMYNVHMYHFS